jgi:hypothetical protein
VDRRVGVLDAVQPHVRLALDGRAPL